ncbi:hypothetical protein AURDEDRAFT_187928 [Auricularia subglabra TFB-10046 SS5]|nr:hypothetical protein AURDEDRAFT_187928 [Auricularia subglabra TFB-10046 SS5]
MNPKEEPKYPYIYPESESDRAALLAKLAGWKLRAKPNALATLTLGKPVHVDVEPSGVYCPDQVDFERCQRPCPHFEWPAPRQRYELKVADGIHGLTRIKNPGHIGSAQVYRGEMSTTEGGSVSVAVKIYQGSLHPAMDYLKYQMDLTDTNGQEFWNTTLLPYIKEYKAYEWMKDLQGTVIPIVYGFFEVALPSSEPAIAMIMEFIPTEPIPQFQEGRILYQTDFNDLMSGLSAALHMISHCGVVHGFDASPTNMIWTAGNLVTLRFDDGDGRGSHSVPFPVLFDFPDVENVDTESMKLYSVLTNHVRAMLHYATPVSVVKTWWEQTIGDHRRSFIPRAFDVPQNGLRMRGVHPAGAPG